MRLNPLLIGSLFPSHGEDRLIVAPGDIPPLLTDTLKAVEDRRYDSHFGIDPIAAAFPVRPAKSPPFRTSPPPMKAPT